MQLLVKILTPQVEVVAAMDINTVSNEVYKHNHPSTNLLNKNIAGLTKKELVKLAPDVVVMSPPCQPHTRHGRVEQTPWK